MEKFSLEYTVMAYPIKSIMVENDTLMQPDLSFLANQFEITLHRHTQFKKLKIQSLFGFWLVWSSREDVN